MKKHIVLFCLSALLSLFAFGCGSDSEDSESDSLTGVSISGSGKVKTGKTATLKAVPTKTGNPSITYTWSISAGETGSTLDKTDGESVTVTAGATTGTVTIGLSAKATIDGTEKTVEAENFTIEITEAETISASDTPTGWASVEADSCFGKYSEYTSVTVSNKTDFVKNVKAGKKIIYVNGEIDLSDGMLPSAYDESTSALDSWIATKTNNAYTTLADWRVAYAKACSSTTNDKTSGNSAGSSLNSTLWTLENAYKEVVQVAVASNTMIIGMNENAVIKGGCLSLSGVSNVAIRNLTIKDAYDPFPHHEKSDGFNSQYDCITIQGTCSHIWIDHCTFMDSFTDHLYVTLSDGSTTEKWVTYDGLLDMKGALTYATVSYCKFSSHDKTMLIGSDDTESFSGTRTVSLSHNYFKNCVQRLPMVRITNLHAYNNYYDFSKYSATKKILDATGAATTTTESISSSYAIGVRAKAQIISENNYFSSGIQYAYSGSSNTKEVGDSKENCVSSTLIYIAGDSNNSSKTSSNSSYYTVSSTKPFTPSYSYELDEASDVPSIVEENAGAGVCTVVQ